MPCPKENRFSYKSYSSLFQLFRSAIEMKSIYQFVVRIHKVSLSIEHTDITDTFLIRIILKK